MDVEVIQHIRIVSWYFICFKIAILSSIYQYLNSFPDFVSQVNGSIHINFCLFKVFWFFRDGIFDGLLIMSGIVWLRSGRFDAFFGYIFVGYALALQLIGVRGWDIFSNGLIVFRIGLLWFLEVLRVVFFYGFLDAE